MDGASDAEIALAGANARAVGIDYFSNPYYRAESMPAATGERVEDWVRKAEAWRAGWEVEDMMAAHV